MKKHILTQTLQMLLSPTVQRQPECIAMIIADMETSMVFEHARERILNLCRQAVRDRQLLHDMHKAFGISSSSDLLLAMQVALGERVTEECRQLVTEFGRGTVCDVCRRMTEKDRFFPFIANALQEAVRKISY